MAGPQAPTARAARPALTPHRRDSRSRRPLPRARAPRPRRERWPWGRTTPGAGPRPRGLSRGRTAGAGAAVRGGRPRAIPGGSRRLPTPVPSAGGCGRERQGPARSRPVGRVAAASPSTQNLPASAPPGASPGGARGTRDPGRRGRLRGLGPARPGSEGSGAGAGSAPKGRQIPTGAARRRAALLAGRREGAGREEEEREGRAGRRPLARTYQSPRRSNVPAAHQGGGGTGPQRSRCSGSLTSAAERCSSLPAPFSWNSAQSLQLPPGAADRTRSSEIRMALGQDRLLGYTMTTGWKLRTSESSQPSEPDTVRDGCFPLTSQRPVLAACGQICKDLLRGR